MPASAPGYELLLTQPFAENTWFVKCEATRQLAIVDPGNGSAAHLQQLIADGWTCQHILLTHAHLDHTWDLPAVKQLTGAPIRMHAGDVELLQHVPEQARMFGVPGSFDMPQPDELIDTGDTVTVGEHTLQVFHTPGHSPGGICFYRGAATLRREGDGDDWTLAVETAGDGDSPCEGECIVGDLVICGSVGRTDLPGGDEPQLLHSIRARLFALPDETAIHAGHCEVSTIGTEKRTNQVVGSAAGGRFSL